MPFRDFALLIIAVAGGYLIVSNSSTLTNPQLAVTLATSVITLTGVVLTLRQTQRVHERNLANENRKVREQREYDAKKQAILDAAKAIISFQHYLVKIPGLESEDRMKLNPAVANFGVKINILHFYLSNRTIEKCIELLEIYNIAQIEILKHWDEMEQSKFEDVKAHNKITHLQGRNKELEEETADALKNIKSLCKEGNVNKMLNLTDKVLEISRNQDEMINILTNSKERSVNIHERFQRCRAELYIHIPKCQKVWIEFLILARQELGYEFDAAEYTKSMNALQSKMMKAIKGKIEHHEKITEKSFQDMDSILKPFTNP